jgi:hypothetical protein
MVRGDLFRYFAGVIYAAGIVFLASCPVDAHSISFQTKSPDFDGSGLVDFADFLVFAAAFGTSSSAEDLDNSGLVDFSDFWFLLQRSGPQETEAVVVENLVMRSW